VGAVSAFDFRVRKSGVVHIMRDRVVVTTLRGDQARRFVAQVEHLDTARAQQLMARVTGNYRHGNEREGKSHSRREC
jgi:hypothetical protein